MKNLIRKILKENDFEWVEGLDVNAAEKEVKGPFDKMRTYHSVRGDELYDLLIQYGVRQPAELKEIGEWLYDEFDSLYDAGYENGVESCDCDGCCDDMIYYDDHHDEVEDAKEEAYNNGFEEGKKESESEIEELRARIDELESQVNEGQNKKNIKRI